MRNVLRMSKFGRMGRWGNQLFQYMFLKQYAAAYNLEVQVPAWAGEELYGLRDARPDSRPLPKKVEKGEHGIDDTLFPHLPPAALANCDVEGWFQYHTSYYRPHAAEHLAMFAEPSPAIKERLRPALAQLTDPDKITIGLHFRRGDYGRNMFYITPVDWYVAWLREYYMPDVNGKIFVATETLSILDELREKFPAEYVTAEDLGLQLKDKPLANYNYLPLDKREKDPRALDFFSDWYILQKACDVILMPNSTFSFGAAMLSTKLSALWRSTPSEQKFVLIEPWDSMPAQFIKQKDYEHVPGLYLRSNPYWHD